jgi:hypothetical protein
MRNRIAGALLVLACTAGCTTVSDTPATAPSTTLVTSTQSIDETTTTLTVPETTTTLDRVSEIEAIFLDLERRRLQAILDQDEEAYRSVFANEHYEQESMVLLEVVEVLDPDAVQVDVLEIFVDSPDCIAAEILFDRTGAIVGGESGVFDRVLELNTAGWGISWTGTGWRCDGPHPLSP